MLTYFPLKYCAGFARVVVAIKRCDNYPFYSGQESIYDPSVWAYQALQTTRLKG